MWSWFGGGSAASRKDSPKNAILNLRSQLDMLQKREKHLQNQIEEQQNVARKNATTNKNGKNENRPAITALSPASPVEGSRCGA